MTNRIDNGVGDYGMALTSTEARIVASWQGTDPMHSEDEVRRALNDVASGGDIGADQVDGLLPGVCREARAAGLLV